MCINFVYYYYYSSSLYINFMYICITLNKNYNLLKSVCLLNIIILYKKKKTGYDPDLLYTEKENIQFVIILLQ